MAIEIERVNEIGKKMLIVYIDTKTIHPVAVEKGQLNDAMEEVQTKV